MGSMKAIPIMIAWTAVVALFLFLIGAHEPEHYRNPIWAIGIGIALLVTHLVNMALYFKIAGERPFEWFK